jgi:hypothetical protein
MATKKKTRKKSPKSTKSGGKPPVKRHAQKKKAPKKPAKRKVARTKAAGKRKAKAPRITIRRKTGSGTKTKKSRNQGRQPDSLAFPRETSGLESGDLQGLSNVESADSESVDELLEEGNAFEAGIVAGVESADDADEKEVHTHEVPEDDVPREYLDDDDNE